MKLANLELTNFRSFRGISVPLDAPRCLFAGLNGSGKSSVSEAIAWALTGCCKGTDGRGAGAEVLIPEGGKIAEVGVTIEGIGKVTRTYAEKGGGSFSVEGFTGTSAIQASALMMKLNTTPEFLRACLDTSVFLDLSHVEAKAMVLSLLGVKFQPHGPDGESWTLDELDLRYKQAFEDRKAAKKALAGAVVPEKPSAQMPALGAIEIQLKKLRKDHADLKQAVGSTGGQRKALADELARLQVVADAAVGEDLSGQIDGLQAKLASLEAQIVPVQAEAPKKGDPARLTFLRGKVAELQHYEPSKECVLEAGIPCKTPGKAFGDRLAALVKELKALDPKPEKAPQTPTESPLTAVRKQLAAFQDIQSGRASQLREKEKAEGRIQEIRQELDGLPDTAAQDAEIATLEGRISKGEDLLRTARMHWHSVAVYEDALKRHQIQKAEVERLEALVEQLGPNGIRVQALADAMGKFEAAVNPYLAAFGWTIGFTVDPWLVSANGRPVETYSESEQFRIGLSLQLGIAMLSGLKFAVVDRLDMLTLKNRGIVTNMLIKAPLDQIIILGSREPEQKLPNTDPEKPKIAGLLCYRLELMDKGSIIKERSAV